MNIDKLKIEKNDIIIITVGSNTLKEEAYSILTNIKKELNDKNVNSPIIITTPNIRLSSLSDEELDKIGLKRK